MKSLLLTLSLLITTMLFSQSVLFQEDFEGTLKMTSSSSGAGNWVVNTRLQSQGLKSDSATVTQGDTTYLTITSAVDATGLTSVYLQFSQIAKVEFFDKCIVEVSANGGSTWTRLTSNEYLGAGLFLNNSFTVGSYPIEWQASNPFAQPQNSWWKTELFNISAIAGNSANVKVRFVLIDGNNNGSMGHAGWFLDDVKLMGALSELTPPSVSLLWPSHLDTVTQGADYQIKAKITDFSGVDTAMIAYVTSTGIVDTVAMHAIATDTFQGTIPFIGFDRIIDYKIIAVDQSPAANMTIDPDNGYYRIVAKPAQGMGFVAYQQGFENGFPSDWMQVNYDNMDWTRNTGATGSPSTGPLGAYEGSYYMYTKGINNNNKTAVIETPQFDLDSIYEPMVSFRYHMYGATMGELHFEVLTTNGVWVDLWSIAGEQQTSSGDSWREAVVDVSAYQSDTTKFRFRGVTGSNYKSDMAIDDFKLGGSYLLVTDIGVDQILNPTSVVMANTPMPVQLTFSNFGSDVITSASIGWALDGVPQTPYSYTGSLAHGAQTPSITIGNPTLTSGTHTIKTWTENPNGIADLNFYNDSMEVNFYACDNLLSGIYTIDPNGSGATNYHSFTEALLALSQCGVDGPVTFNVASGVYNEQLSILPINGTSATNTVTFKAASGDSSTVILKYDASGAADNYVVKLDGASYITFKDMSIVAENSVYARVFVLDNYVHDLSITNSVVKSELLSANNSDNKALVFGIDSVGDNIYIQNSRLVNGSYAVYLEGGAVASNGWNFTNNRIDGYYYSGVYLKNANSAVISNNYMRADTTSTVSEHKGIYLLENSGSAVVSNNEVYSKLTAKPYGIRISDCSFDVNTPASIYNNMVQTHSTNNAGCGILIHNTENCNLYYNTVHVVGNASGNGALMLLKNNGGTFNNVNIVNNIFTNSDGYLIKTTGVDIANFSNNYNDLYNFSGTKFISYNGDNIDNLADWQSESGEGANSVDYDPYYLAAGDLHISNNQLNGIATHIAGITTDIDGDVRNASASDMGADEFAASPNDIYAIDFESPMGDCGLSNAETVAVLYKNVGSATISSFDAKYRVAGSSTIVSETVSSTILPGDTFLYTFNTTVDLDVNATGVDSIFEITAWGTLTGDSDHSNDTIFTEVLSGFVPDTIHVDNDTIMYLQSDTLYVSGINPYWWSSDTSTTELANDTLFITGPLYDTTTYWVSDRASSGVINVQVGNGTVTNSGYTYPSPYANASMGNKDQYLFLASELTAMGIRAGAISGIQFDVAALNSVPTLNNYAISIGSTTDNALTTWVTGLTVVYSPSSYTPVNGWNDHPFTTPFIWDGVSNIVVQVCSNNATYVGNGNASVNSTITNFNSVLNYRADASNVCQSSSISNVFPRTQRPNIKFTTTALGCFSDRTPVTVVVTGFPQNDASLEAALLEPAGSVPSGVNTAIKAVLKNFGQANLTSVKIPYSINGTVEDTITWTGNLPYNTVDTIVIDSVNFKGGAYSITAYTMMPNGVVDSYNTNDTATTSFIACMSGAFTIGDSINGNADYGSFSSAVHALNEVGVCGNVVFNVEAGTYNERFVLDEVVGAGPNSSITFQSASGDSTSVVIIDTAIGSFDNYIVKFNGADYFTFQNMTFKAGASSFARLIDISNESEHNTFANNVFEMPVSATPNVCAIYSSGSNDNYLTITNNHIINGGYAIFLRGVSANNREKGLIIDGNIIEGFGAYGVNVNNMDSTIIVNNKLVTSLGSNMLQALYANYVFDGFIIANNDIQITQGGGYSAVYGLRLNNGNAQAYASGLATGYVYNNMINIRAGSGAKFGLYSYYCDNVNFYYNTVNVSGQGPNGRALYQYNSAASSIGEIFINNNFIDSTGGYAAYFGTPATVNTSNYNNFYSEGGNVAYWFGAKNTLADLQAVSGKDAHSISVLPLFQAPDDLHVVTTNLSAKGTPIGFITTDIDGELRNVNQPTIGADEVYAIPIDIGVYDLMNIPDTTSETTSIPIIVSVKNYGMDTIPAFTISYTVNNGTPVTYAYTDTLVPDQLDTVVLNPMLSPAGNSTICVTTELATDTNSINDGICHDFYGIPNKDAYVTMIEGFDETCGMTTDTVKVWITNLGVDTINAVGQTGQTSVSFISDLGASASPVTESFNTVVAPGDTVSYTFTTLIDFTNSSQYDSVFHVAAWVTLPGDNVTYNDTVYTNVNSVRKPADPIFISPIAVPYGTSVVLAANAVDTILWYHSDTTFVDFHQGATYTTPTMYNDDTLYLQAVARSGMFKLTETVQHKSGVGSGNYPSYLPTTDWDGIEISNIAMVQSDLSGYEVNVSVGTTTMTYVFPAGTMVGGGSTVLALYGSGLAVGPAGNNVFYIGTHSGIIPSSQVSYWLKDPNGNIVDAFASNGAQFPVNSGVSTDDFSGSLMSGSGSVGAIRTIADNNLASDWVVGANGVAASFGVANPQIPLKSNLGCASNRVPLIINVGNQNANDVAASLLVSPTTDIYLKTNEMITVRVKNFGTADQDTIPVAYVLNNNAPVIDTVFSNVAANDSIDYTFSTPADLSIADSTYAIHVYTDLATDVNHLNDTLHTNVTHLVAVYCTSGAVSTLDEDIGNVTFASINNTSSAPYKATFTDYTNIAPAQIQAGMTYPISVDIVFDDPVWASTGYCKVYIDYNQNGVFDEPSEIAFESVYNGPTTLTGNVKVPYNALPGTVRMRVIARNGANASMVSPCGPYSSGETEDYMVVIAPSDPIDAGVEAIINPKTISENLASSLSVRVRNYGTDTINSVDVSYILNGAAPVSITYNTTAIAPRDSMDVSFGNITLQEGLNTICAFTTLTGDTNTFNDTICKTTFVYPTVNLDYTDDFEGQDLWMADTVVNQWERGVPAMTNINSAHSSANVWGIDLDGQYANNSSQYLYSPRIVTTGLDSAILKFWHYFDTQSYDGGTIQVSIDNGPWIILGLQNDPNGTNWYNSSFGGNPWWSGSSNGWVESTYKLMLNNTTFNHPDIIQFRFQFFSNLQGNYADGWAIDDFSVETFKIAQDAGVVAISTPVASVPVGSNVTVAIDVKNFGTDPLINIPVSYTIGATTETATFTIPAPGLLPGEVKTYTFATGFTAPNADFNICAKTEMNDAHPQNDETCKQVHISMAPIDVQTIGLSVDQAWSDTTKITLDNTVRVQVVNNGTTTLTSINFEYRVNNAPKGTGTWTGSLASMDTLVYTFTDTYKSPLNYYQVCAKATVIGDADLTNNDFCKTYLGVNNVGIEGSQADGFSVKQNRPNPAHGKVTVDFNIPQSGKVHFELRNALGQVIISKELDRQVGKNQIEIDATSLTSGIYYYTIVFNNHRITKKMLVNN